MSNRGNKPVPTRLKPPSVVNNPLRNAASAVTVSNAKTTTIPIHKTGMKRQAASENTDPKPNASTKAAPDLRSIRPAVSTVRATSSRAQGFASTSRAPLAARVASSKRPELGIHGRLHAAEAKTQELEEQARQSQLMVATMETQIQLSQSHVRELEVECESLRQQLATKSAENQSQQQCIDSLRLEIEQADAVGAKDKEMLIVQHRETCAKWEIERIALHSDLHDCQKKMAECESQIEALRSTVSNQSASIYALEAELVCLKEQLAHTSADLEGQVDLNHALKKRIADLEVERSCLEKRLREDEAVRRRLHNTIQELKGNIRVFCRVRPPVGNEAMELPHLQFDDSPESKEIALLVKTESANGRSIVKENAFQFDRVFQPRASQNDVFEEISQLVQSACDGYNVCIFAYGQTGSGKTFTMEGPNNGIDDLDTMGVIPRSVLQVWGTAEKLAEKGWSYEMNGSFVEIYNETINDLLVDGADATQVKYDIKHDPIRRKTWITGATDVLLSSPMHVMELLKRAARNRKVASTQCNDRSSRSHSVFTLRITGSNSITGEACDGSLNLVDLAGSERLSSSGSTNDRLKETQAINKSLSALGDVIAALATKDATHIPYRNSKLTYLLQYALGGNSKTLMFVNISPTSESVNESLCSLRFATKVNNCQIGTATRQTKPI